MKKVLLITLLLATGIVNAAGWSQVGTVKKIYQFPGYTMFQLTGTAVNKANPNCTSTAYYVLKQANADDYDRYYSLLLGAYFAKTNVQVWLSDFCGGQNNNFQVISTIQTS